MSTASQPLEGWRALTIELRDPHSPVRHFLDDRFAAGLPEAQRRYRGRPAELAVPPAPAAAANPGTIGTAADWLLRFLLHPQPDLHLAMAGVFASTAMGISTLPAFGQIAQSLGVPRSVLANDMRALSGAADARESARFTGPVPGSTADPEHLARACWAIALLTEAFRAGPRAAQGPLGQFRGRRISGEELLELAPPTAISQLAAFRQVYETELIPQLAARPGLWALGPVFTGSALMPADADLITGGLLTDLKTSAKKPSLSVQDLYQVIGYALLDFADEYQIDSVAIYSARHASLTAWPLPGLLSELAGQPVSIPGVRAEFQRLLMQPYAGGG